MALSRISCYMVCLHVLITTYCFPIIVITSHSLYQVTWTSHCTALFKNPILSTATHVFRSKGAFGVNDSLAGLVEHVLMTSSLCCLAIIQ